MIPLNELTPELEAALGSLNNLKTRYQQLVEKSKSA